MKETLVPSDEYQIRFYCNSKSSKTCWLDPNPREDGTYVEMTLQEAFRYASGERSVKCHHCGSRMQPDSYIRRKEKTRLETLESELWSLTDDDQVESWLEDYREAALLEEDCEDDGCEEIVFVYGTLKKGFGNHSLLNGSRFLGEGILEDSTLKLVDLGFCPAIVRVPDTENLCGNGVAGELYFANNKTLLRLDALESNGILYTRERLQVTYYCHETEMTREATAWVYLLLEGNLELLSRGRVNTPFELPKSSSCVDVNATGIQRWIKQEHLQEPFEGIEQ